MNIQEQVDCHEVEIKELDKRVDAIQEALARIQGGMSEVALLIRWVIVPLLGIVAALVGIKLIIP